MKFIYQKITDLIIEKLQSGVVPWQKTWHSALPKNLVSGLEYRGINIMLLGLQDYNSNYWLTFKQCKDLGGSVKRDEHSSLVVFWKPFVRVTDDKDDEKSAEVNYLLRYYYVFNMEQCNLPDDVLTKRNIIYENPKIVKAEEIISGYKNPPDIITNNIISNPKYIPRYDRIEIQSINTFYSADEYYASLYHELVHSTGAKHRLARRGVIDTIQFGSENYSKEELVAEIGASFLCNMSGIHQTLDNQTAYIQNWLEVLNNDNRIILTAAGQAQKATDYILNIISTQNQETI